MKVEFIRANDGNLMRTRDIDVIPRKPDVIKLSNQTYYIDEVVYNLETNVYRVYMYSL